MSKVKKTSNAKKGGLFVGNSHDDGGIPAIVVDTGQPVEVEGGEAIINKEATAKHWKELSRINQSAGNGVPIPPPSNFSPEVAAYKKGGVVSVSELKKGTAMEMEHEDTIKKYAKEGVPLKVVARDIATDHLKENPNYYKILTKLKLAKGGQIVCRSCSNDWIKKDDSYVCDSCGEDNTSFYKTKKTPVSKPKNKVKKTTSSKKKYNLGGFTAVSGLFDGSQVNEETGETPLEEAARLNQSGTFREKRMFLKAHPEILMLLKKGGKLNTAQNLKVAKVMHEFKNGELYSSSGDKVTERAQALAIALSEANNLDKYAAGGKLTESEKSDIYNEWKSLINMSSSELKEFYSSEDGKKAGLSASEAKELGIDNGRKSARWILKMQAVNHNKWTPEMWEWAKKQISFVKRMSGVKGDLYDDKGNKTDKYLALLIWGNNPEKYANGGKTSELLAPNGKPSKLTPEQYNLVRTPEFKAWFGDWENHPESASKAVDENGEPLVVYHGTNRHFTVFNLEKVGSNVDYGMWGSGFYFSPLKSFSKKYGSNLMKVFLNIKAPFVRNPNLTGSLSQFKPVYGKKESLQLRNDILEANYDGVIQYESGQKNMLTQIVVYEPNQIKLADGTNTTFNPENPDIRFKKGGKVTDLIAPNGHISNLSPELYKFVRTNKFKDWFGDWENNPENASKVVDKNGEPLVVYRAVTKIGEFPTPLSSEHFYTDNLQLARKYSILRKRKIKHAFLKVMFINEMDASNGVYSENPKLYNDFFRNSADGFDGSVLRHIIMPPTDMKGQIPSSSVYSIHNLAQVMSTDGEIEDDSEDLSNAAAKYDGFLFDGKQEKIYKEWNRLINMSVDEMADFMHTEKAHNLSKKELKELDIDMNLPKRIHKMKSKPANKWTIQDWRSAQAQIAFIKKMLISDDQLYNVDGKKTKQHHLLLVGGHNPVKYKAGGRLAKKYQGGDCYCIAGKFALNDVSEIGGHKFIGTPYVVHAEVEGRGALTGIRYGHAWVEDDLMIFDYSNSKKIIFPKELYYTMGKVIQEQPKYYKYTFEEACQKMQETGHYGCWDLITESGL